MHKHSECLPLSHLVNKDSLVPALGCHLVLYEPVEVWLMVTQAAGYTVKGALESTTRGHHGGQASDDVTLLFMTQEVYVVTDTVK